MLALEFPPINEVIRWQDLFPTFNKIALIACVASLIGIVIYVIAARRDPMVAPTGVRNVAETGVEFISTFLVRPFSLAVRLFANMLAGHILLVTFALLTAVYIGGALHPEH